MESGPPSVGVGDPDPHSCGAAQTGTVTCNLQHRQRAGYLNRSRESSSEIRNRERRSVLEQHFEHVSSMALRCAGLAIGCRYREATSCLVLFRRWNALSRVRLTDNLGMKQIEGEEDSDDHHPEDDQHENSAGSTGVSIFVLHLGRYEARCPLCSRRWFALNGQRVMVTPLRSCNRRAPAARLVDSPTSEEHQKFDAEHR